MGDLDTTRKPRPAGKTCSVVACKNCSGDIKVWNHAVCSEHAPLTHMDCPCLVPFSMHRFPNGKQNEDRRRKWLANLNRKNFHPGKTAMVCSIHFPDGRPTSMNPYPTQHLGKTNMRVPHKGGIKAASCSTQRIVSTVKPPSSLVVKQEPMEPTVSPTPSPSALDSDSAVQDHDTLLGI
ncbi:uncharacterized protein LOC115331774 [Ixodes scapularis]|uniref:uncharacterized protein LOC115331774 n=1 Tax=Ixodes scapularis TaxID=6945 RepID=UPI001A9F6401|nr:uncharacterized protein LOC115331774 [Ixodes scapularis]